jgi:hypothetical protein
VNNTVTRKSYIPSSFFPNIFDSLAYQNCSASEAPVTFLPNLTESLTTAEAAITNFTETLDLATNLEATCGRNFDAIRGYLSLIIDDYNTFYKNATTIEDFLSCENLHPLYTELTHDIACSEVPEAGLWAIGALFFVSFFSMWMITLRSSWLETRSPESDSWRSVHVGSSYNGAGSSHGNGNNRRISQNSRRRDDGSRIRNNNGNVGNESEREGSYESVGYDVTQVVDIRNENQNGSNRNRVLDARRPQPQPQPQPQRTGDNYSNPHSNQYRQGDPSSRTPPPPRARGQTQETDTTYNNDDEYLKYESDVDHELDDIIDANGNLI